MTLDEILKTVMKSTADDWHKMEAPIEYGWEWGEKRTSDGGELLPYINPHNHHNLAVYRGDIDISLAWGAGVVDNFREPWTKKFPDDDHNRSIVVALRYRGQQVYEWLGVVIDGGRHLILCPERKGDGFVLPREKLALAELLCHLGPGTEPLASVLERADIRIE